MTEKPEVPEFLRQVGRDCVAVRVRLINRVITAIYDEALRPLGLRVSQANILTAVAHLGEARPAAICRALRIERSTLSRDVEVLKRGGWLASEPPEGGRNQSLRVTPEGLRRLEAALPAWERAQREARALLGDEGVASLRAVAERLGFGVPPG